MNTPLWLTLVVALLSPGGALFGVWVTQRRADRRDDATFARELTRERERWAREDQARTFEHRRTTYVEFHEALRAIMVRAYGHGLGFSDEGNELPEGWQTQAFEAAQRLEVYATPDVREKASVAYSAVWQWGHATRHGQDDDTFYDNQSNADSAQIAVLQSIRADLNVPGTLQSFF